MVVCVCVCVWSKQVCVAHCTHIDTNTHVQAMVFEDKCKELRDELNNIHTHIHACIHTCAGQGV